jgi:hypothetical protein
MQHFSIILSSVLLIANIGLWFFIGYSILTVAGLLLLLTSIHVSLDIYGLIRPVKGRKLKVHYRERISKILLSQRYVPQNFDTVILGTSLSDNLDMNAGAATSRKRIYNASIMGADISTLNIVAQNLVRGGIKKMIICVSPYMMKRSAATNESDTSWVPLYTIGRKFVYEAYMVALFRFFGIMKSKFPPAQYDAEGVNHYYPLFSVQNIEQKIAAVIEDNKDRKIFNDPYAILEFESLLHFLEANDVNYLLYFHPLPHEILLSKEEEYQTFHELIHTIVRDSSRLVDFNGPEYLYFTCDHTNYLDHGHLSFKGQRIIAEILHDRIKSKLREPVMVSC